MECEPGFGICSFFALVSSDRVEDDEGFLFASDISVRELDNSSTTTGGNIFRFLFLFRHLLFDRVGKEIVLGSWWVDCTTIFPVAAVELDCNFTSCCPQDCMFSEGSEPDCMFASCCEEGSAVPSKSELNSEVSSQFEPKCVCTSCCEVGWRVVCLLSDKAEGSSAVRSESRCLGGETLSSAEHRSVYGGGKFKGAAWECIMPDIGVELGLLRIRNNNKVLARNSRAQLEGC